MNRGLIKTGVARLSASRGAVLMFAVVLCGLPTRGNAQTNVVYASQIPGVVLDANLNGSPTQACTDNTAKLNAVLATATALHPIDLIMDGATCIDNIVPAGSRGPWDQTCINLIGLSNVTIEGQGAGTGFFLKSQANCAAIQNIALWGYPPAGARTMSNYVFKSFRVAGNSDQVCTGGVCTAIKIFDAENVVLDNITITDIKYFATGFGNVSNVTISNSTILQPPTSGTDPLHFTGPADHIVIKNNRLQSHDDCVALNAPEAYGGNISYVTITGTQMVGTGCSDFMRIYNYIGGYGGSAFWSTDHIVVDGLFGTANCAANPSVFYFGEAGHSGSAKLNNLHASHIDVDGSGNCELAWFAGTWGEAYISDWVLRNPKPNTPAILITGTIDAGTFKNGVVKRNTSAQATAYPFQVTDYSTTGTNLSISNITELDTPGSSFNAAPQLLDIQSGYVGTLTLGAPLNRNGKIANLFSAGSAARVSSVVGASSFDYPSTQILGSNTQAILTYTCSGSSAVVVSTSATYASGVLSSPVDDTNEALFPGSTSGNRAGSGVAPNNTSLHYFVAGTRKAQLANDGKYHSRALPANSLMYFQVNCDGTILPARGGSYTFHTSNIAGNETHNELPEVDSTGTPIIPTVPDTRSFDFIDPKTGAQIRNMYVSTDSNTVPYLYSGGSVHMCSETMTGPGPGWLCNFPGDGGGSAMLYYIIPSTREIRYLGRMGIVSPDAAHWPACGSSSLSGGMLDAQFPNLIFGTTEYLVSGSCAGTPVKQNVVIRGEYTDPTYSAVTSTTNAQMTWTLMTPAPKFISGMYHDFDATFDTAKFPSCGFAAQGQYGYSACQRSSQASYAWYAAFDMGDRLPPGSCINCMHVIGAIKYDNAVNRWTGTHNGSLAPGDANVALIIPGYSEGCAYDTNWRPCDPTLYPQVGMGPYASKLTTNITTSATTFTVDGQPRSLSDYVTEPYLMDMAVGDQVYACPGSMLAGGITSRQTTIQVTNGAQFPNGARVFIGTNPTETVHIISGGGTNTWIVTRGTDGSTASAYASGTGVAQWYNDCRDGEKMTITNVSNFPVISVARNTPARSSTQAWVAGTNLVMNGQRQADAGVHPLWWAFLTAPHGEAKGLIPEVNPDFSNGHNDWTADRWVMEAYHVRTGSLFSQVNQAATLHIDPSVTFAGVAGIGPGNSYTRYPNVDKVDASYLNQQWFLDYSHFQGGDPFSANPGAVLVPGKTQIYKYVFCTVAANNCGGSESTLHRRIHPTWARAGDHILTDVSGPSCSIVDGAGGAWTYGVVEKNGECVAGSRVGEAYANIPGLTISQCQVLEHPNGRVDWCMVDTTFSGNGVTQFSMIPGTNGYGKKLTSMLSVGGSPDQALAKPTPDGGLIFFRTRTDKMFLLTTPPFRFIPDEYDRTTFIPVSVTVPPSGMSLPNGTSTVAVQHGYAEYGGNCTTRNDACVDVTSGQVPTVPFSYASENPTRLACASGCAVTVPALSSRTLYTSIKYYDSLGGVLRADTLPPVIVAPAGFDGPAECSISPTLLGAGTVGSAYTASLTGVNCGSGPFAWTVGAGALPAGLSLNGSTGAIAGTPTTAATYAFTVHATDNGMNSADVSYSVTINAARTCAITPSNLPGGAVGTSYDGGALAASNCGAGPFTWTVNSGSLPTGLILNGSTGLISGTPTAAAAYTFTMGVTGSDSASQVYSVTITGTAGGHRSYFGGGKISAGGKIRN